MLFNVPRVVCVQVCRFSQNVYSSAISEPQQGEGELGCMNLKPNFEQIGRDVYYRKRNILCLHII